MPKNGQFRRHIAELVLYQKMQLRNNILWAFWGIFSLENIWGFSDGVNFNSQYPADVNQRSRQNSPVNYQPHRQYTYKI